MGELHLDIKIDILRRTYGVELEVVSRRWRTVRPSLRRSKTATHKKRRVVQVSSVRSTTASHPDSGDGYVFTSSVVGGNVPKFFPAIEKGFQVMMEEGPLAASPFWMLRLNSMTAASTRLTRRLLPSS